MSIYVECNSRIKEGVPRITREVEVGCGENAADRGVKMCIPVSWQPGEMIPLLEEGETLIVQPPEGMDFRRLLFSVKSDVDVSVICSRSEGCWKIKPLPSTDPGADAPVTLNLNFAEDEEDEEDDESTNSSGAFDITALFDGVAVFLTDLVYGNTNGRH